MRGYGTLLSRNYYKKDSDFQIMLGASVETEEYVCNFQ